MKFKSVDILPVQSFICNHPSVEKALKRRNISLSVFSFTLLTNSAIRPHIF